MGWAKLKVVVISIFAFSLMFIIEVKLCCKLGVMSRSMIDEP